MDGLSQKAPEGESLVTVSQPPSSHILVAVGFRSKPGSGLREAGLPEIGSESNLRYTCGKTYKLVDVFCFLGMWSRFF